MNPRYQFLEEALKHYGVAEIAGAKHNPVVVEWLSRFASWVKDDETPWCSAFVNAIVDNCGHVGTRRLNARSWLAWGARTHAPRPGDIVVLWRESPASAKGHVGFFVRETHEHIYILGGNQGNRVSIAAYPRTRLLEYRTANA